MEKEFPYKDNTNADITPFVPEDAQVVLDVGCAFGAFGEALKRVRPTIEVWGIEPNPDAASRARDRMDCVVTGSFPEDAPDRRFDCVVFNDVLEHFPDPWEVLRAASKLLGPTGRIVATIPNVRHMSVVIPLVFRGNWRYRDSGILDRTHLRFFTRRGMIELFEASGFRVEAAVPIRIARPLSGEISFLLSLFGPLGTDFRTKHYVIVASRS